MAQLFVLKKPSAQSVKCMMMVETFGETWGLLKSTYTIDLQAKKQPKNYKFCTILAFLFSCERGIRISKIDQININSTRLNLLNHMKFVTIKVD